MTYLNRVCTFKLSHKSTVVFPQFLLHHKINFKIVSVLCLFFFSFNNPSLYQQKINIYCFLSVILSRLFKNQATSSFWHRMLLTQGVTWEKIYVRPATLAPSIGCRMDLLLPLRIAIACTFVSLSLLNSSLIHLTFTTFFHYSCQFYSRSTVCAYFCFFREDKVHMDVTSLIKIHRKELLVHHLNKSMHKDYKDGHFEKSIIVISSDTRQDSVLASPHSSFKHA